MLGQDDIIRGIREFLNGQISETAKLCLNRPFDENTKCEFVAIMASFISKYGPQLPSNYRLYLLEDSHTSSLAVCDNLSMTEYDDAWHIVTSIGNRAFEAKADVSGPMAASNHSVVLHFPRTKSCNWEDFTVSVDGERIYSGCVDDEIQLGDPLTECGTVQLVQGLAEKLGAGFTLVIDDPMREEDEDVL